MANEQRKQAAKADPTVSRNTAPNTDDSVVEAMDETTPGTGSVQASVSQPANPQRGKTPHAGKAA